MTQSNQRDEIEERTSANSDRANVRDGANEASRLLMVSAWLRPLAKAPAAARELVGRAERIASETTRALRLPRTKISPILLSLIGAVVAPAFAATVYFAFLASDQFVAETRFAVRTPNGEPDQAQSDTGKGASSTSSLNFAFTASGQNAYIVTSYIRSRAIVDDLSAKLNLREIFRRPEADFWARLRSDASIDELTDYWNSMVVAYVDTISGIVVVKLRAFRRDDAVTLGKAVIDASEMLVNRISERARRDATAMSEKDVRRAYAAVQSALAELHEFRDKAGMIAPDQATSDIGKLLIPLMTEKIRLESDLFVAAREMNEDAPTIRVLKNQLETVGQQISALKAKLTSVESDGRTVAAALAKFEELDIQRQLTEKLYALAQADLDRAQMRANRQTLYLSVFVPPSLPEESRYPRRIAFPILIFLGLGVVWAIVAMVIASVNDHRL